MGLASANARLAAARTTQEVVAIALSEAPSICEADATGVYLFRSGQLDVYSHNVPERAVADYLDLPPDSDQVLGRMIQTLEPVHDRSMFTEAEWRALPAYEL